MIVFLNFAPLNFGGGAEKWMIDVSEEVSKKENLTLLDVHQSVSNYYGRLVLKRPFDKRIHVSIDNSRKHLSLKWKNFLPFSKDFNKVKNVLENSRVIYIRYELLETLIVLYFGGFKNLQKTVAGIHSPFIYRSPIAIMDRLHNIVYSSYISRYFLSKMNKVHVLIPQDENYFKNIFQLKNIVRIPNYIDIPNKSIEHKQQDNKLDIAFIGELNLRKGTDKLLDIIKNSPDEFRFHIAGDGVFKDDIKELTKSGKVKYYGYVSEEKLQELLGNSDVLLQTSRAETFSLVALMAMSQGKPIVSSIETDLSLPHYIQISNNTTTKDYISNLKTVNCANTLKIKEYYKNNFSKEIIIKELRERLFN